MSDPFVHNGGKKDMIEDINVYKIDGKEIDKKDWDDSLVKEFEKAKNNPMSIVKAYNNSDINIDIALSSSYAFASDIEDIYEYLDDYKHIRINDHRYSIETIGYSYESFKELCDDLLEEAYCTGEYTIIDDILKEMSEEELNKFFTKSNVLHFENGKIIRDA